MQLAIPFRTLRLPHTYKVGDRVRVLDDIMGGARCYARAGDFAWVRKIDQFLCISEHGWADAAVEVSIGRGARSAKFLLLLDEIEPA